jgi:hypothetical protein
MLVHKWFTVPKSVEERLQKSKGNVRLMDNGVLEEDYCSEWDFSRFLIPNKNGTKRVVTDFRTLKVLMKLRLSLIYNSKD